VDVTFLISARNDEARIGKGILFISQAFTSKDLSFEILVLDHASRDRTAEIVESMGARLNCAIRLLRNANPRREKAGVQRAVEEAAGDVMVFLRAAHPAEVAELEAVLKTLRAGAAVAVPMAGAPDPGKRSPRRPGVWVFTCLVGRIAARVAADRPGGPLGFSSAALSAILPRTRLLDSAWMVETIFLAEKLRFPIMEVPFSRPGGEARTGGFFRWLAMLPAVFRIRGNSFFRRYT
jgi:hypothetical protein